MSFEIFAVKGVALRTDILFSCLDAEVIPRSKEFIVDVANQLVNCWWLELSIFTKAYPTKSENGRRTLIPFYQ